MVLVRNRKEDSRSPAGILFLEQLLFLFQNKRLISCFLADYSALVVVLSTKIVVFKQITVYLLVFSAQKSAADCMQAQMARSTSLWLF